MQMPWECTLLWDLGLVGCSNSRQARFAFYRFFFRYSSIALRISALTGAPVFSEIAFSLVMWPSSSQMFVRFILPIYTYRQKVSSGVTRLPKGNEGLRSVL